ncbi:SGNH/GDSL hydrolase family protein [Bifidobacterium myosotis]|uniref:SGNH/GDSL hydrolase family protein n=1 Tax=Bifidobacterium myosotis TaxID=1630166 RepID=A0A5M9ZI69_9BIFI|nr:SGNH/GDSL hydrolase family protein [Bifidobacterium myosotis]KAA8827250.1 SGNH/GDSL hydrolase family protein [Bifidobacterium myosotis]
MIQTTVGTPRPVDVFVGDSITAGHGVPAEQRWTRLVADKAQHDEINVGVGGTGFDRTQYDPSGANTVSKQLDKAATLAKGRDVSRVFIESFRNDYLGHKTDIDAYRSAYSKLVTDALVKAKNLFPGVPVCFIPSIIPPSPTMTGEKETIDKMLAVSVTAAATVPDVTVMDGDYCWNLLAGTTGTWQSDGVHPTASGHAKAAEGIESWLFPTVSRNLLVYGPGQGNGVTVKVNDDGTLNVTTLSSGIAYRGVKWQLPMDGLKPGTPVTLWVEGVSEAKQLICAVRFNDRTDGKHSMNIGYMYGSSALDRVTSSVPDDATHATLLIRNLATPQNLTFDHLKIKLENGSGKTVWSAPQVTSLAGAAE